MYVPSHFAETDPSVLHALIRNQPLGAWVLPHPDELIVNHIPFYLDPTRGQHGTLVGHVARANPVWQSLSQATPSVVIFQGPQAYISPSWYPSKQAGGKVVPTWNYAVVHAHGTPQIVDDPVRLLEIVTLLTDTHEGGHAAPWQVTDAPADFIDKLLGAIVGIDPDRAPERQVEGQPESPASRQARHSGRAGSVGGGRGCAHGAGGAPIHCLTSVPGLHRSPPRCTVRFFHA